MVDFTTFMSEGLRMCGTDQETFSGLTDLWNREKEAIQDMSRSELRSNLTCP